MSWQEREERCNACDKCSLCKTKTNTVFGVGNKNAKLMFVGEAPGESEDMQGIPFVGAAGKLFDKYLSAVGISRDEVYIANILKCRPPKNRGPRPAEQDKCIKYLKGQIKLIRPKVVVCLGRIAAMRLISPDYKITKEHGTFVERGSFTMTAVYHPAALLRDPRKKEDMYTDTKKIQGLLDSRA